MIYPIISLCHTGYEELTIVVTHEEDFTSLYILDDEQVSAAVGYNDDLDELIWEDWSNKEFEPLWFMDLIFKAESIYET